MLQTKIDEGVKGFILDPDSTIFPSVLSVLEKYPDLKEDDVRTVMQAIAEAPGIRTLMKREVTVRFSVKDVIDFIGREELKEYLQYKTAEVARKPEYEGSKTNIAGMWFAFLMFIVVFSSLSIICLEFIDRDKR